VRKGARATQKKENSETKLGGGGKRSRLGEKKREPLKRERIKKTIGRKFSTK